MTLGILKQNRMDWNWMTHSFWSLLLMLIYYVQIHIP